MANELHTVSYAGFTIDPTSGYQPVGSFTYSKDAAAGRFMFSQDFVIHTNGGESAFKTLYDAIHALNTHNGALVVTHESDSTAISHDPAAYTALNTRAKITAPGDVDRDGQRARLYRLEVTGELPATDLHGSGSEIGFVEGAYTLTLDAGTNRPIYVFSGNYTASPNVGAGTMTARETYEDSTVGARKTFTDWLDSNAIKGTSANYEIIDESRPEDDTNNTIKQFRLVARYRIVPVVDSGDTDRYIVDRLQIGRSRSRGHGAFQAAQDRGAPPSTYAVTFVVRGNSDTIDYDDFAAEYGAKLRPYLRTHLTAVWGGKTFVIDGENYQPVSSDNQIVVAWTVRDTTNGSILSYRHRVRYSNDYHKRFTKLGDGKPHSYDVQAPFHEIRAVQTGTAELLNEIPTKARILQLFPYLPDPPEGAWEVATGEPEIELDHGLSTSGDTPVLIATVTLTRSYQLVASRGRAMTVEAGRLGREVPA